MCETSTSDVAFGVYLKNIINFFFFFFILFFFLNFVLQFFIFFFSCFFCLVFLQNINFFGLLVLGDIF